jgi:hypothetical protein
MTNDPAQKEPPRRTSWITILGGAVFGLGLVAAGVSFVVSGIETGRYDNLIGGCFTIAAGFFVAWFIRSMAAAETQRGEDDTALYELPIFRRAHRAAAPSGLRTADIAASEESSMGNPSTGVLAVSDGLRIEHCNPSFIWSGDSRFLAVPQMMHPPGWRFRVRLLVIDTRDKVVYASRPYKAWLQPESFAADCLVVRADPFGVPSVLRWNIPGDLAPFEALGYDEMARRHASHLEELARAAQEQAEARRIHGPHYGTDAHRHRALGWMPVVLTLAVWLALAWLASTVDAYVGEHPHSAGHPLAPLWTAAGIFAVLGYALGPLKKVYGALENALRDLGWSAVWTLPLAWIAMFMLGSTGAPLLFEVSNAYLGAAQPATLRVQSKEFSRPLTWRNRASYYLHAGWRGHPVRFKVTDFEFERTRVGDVIHVRVIQGRWGYDAIKRGRPPS